MLVVKIELWPFGDKTKAVEIERMHIINDGEGTKDLGDYFFAVKGKISRIKKFPRLKCSSWELLRLVLQKAKKEGL